jgi:hypothetical protein
MMNRDDHALGLGRIIGNLQALELLIRLFLCEATGQVIEFLTGTHSSMNETYLTNYLSLGQLIDCYNRHLTVAESTYSLDKAAVHIRDAIAHGRLLSSSPSFPVTLYKFGKPNLGIAPVELTEVLTQDWLEVNRKAIRTQMNKVLACGSKRNYASMRQTTNLP